jgi:hypothetical protein
LKKEQILPHSKDAFNQMKKKGIDYVKQARAFDEQNRQKEIDKQEQRKKILEKSKNILDRQTMRQRREQFVIPKIPDNSQDVADAERIISEIK